MKFKLRDYVFGALIVFLLFSGLNGLGQEKEEPKPPPYESWYDSLAMIQAKEEAKAEEETKPIKTWKLPAYMQENLQRELNDFNKRFEEKVQVYKKELKTRFKEFKNMPDDVILYLEGGIFITRSDFKKLQEQTREKQNKEVKEKGDDKTTN